MVRIKICGVTEVEHALAAASAGADFVGLVFASSRRQVSPEKARQIAAALRQREPHPAIVGVFVNAPAEEINRLAQECLLDWVQLSGDEGWDFCRRVNRPVIKAVRVAPRQSATDVAAEIEAGLKKSPEALVLLESRVPGAYGGTGQTLDWGLAGEVARRFPIILSGGLAPDNVGQAIARVRPWGVDVSSGVETRAKKEPTRIRAFIEEARRAARDE